MKTGKKTLGVLCTIAFGLLLFMPHVIRERKAPAADETVVIATAGDSLSFAVSMMVAGDMPLAMEEMGVTPETLDDFVRGVCDAFPADESAAAVAYAHGVVVGASAMEMLDEANRAIYQSDTTRSVNARIFLDGLKAVAYGDKSVMTLEQACDYYYRNVFRQPSEEFMARNAKRGGVETLPGGVQVKVEREGTGEVPALGSKVGYIYKASYINGNLAESSRGEVVEAVVGSLLPGLAEAITSLPVGTKCKVYLPWQKAYGAMGSNKVPPYSALVYDIELMKIVKK